MKMNSRMLMRIVAVVIVLGIFGWQWWGKHHGQRATADAGAHASASASVAVAAVPTKPVKPAPPATLKMGTLTLTACQLKRPHSAVTVPAFCAKFPVPENRANPDSRTIDLKLAIVKSDSQLPQKDMVVYLAGGPGQSAIQTYPELAGALAPLLKQHDVLLLDQRGMGGSHLLSCPETGAAMMKLAKQPFDPQRTRAVTAQCLAEVEKTSDPRFYTTSDAVTDLEAVRKALGSPKFDLIGVSYGTRMAQQYAGAHPDAVRSIVLDGVVPNTMILGETFAEALEHSLKLQAAACDEAPACKKAYGDWYQTLHTLQGKLESQAPRQITFNDPRTFKPETRTLTASTLAMVVRLFSYSTATAALLPLAVDEAAKGNYAPLLGQSQMITGDLSGSTKDSMAGMSVVCSEDASFLKPRPQDADTVLGDKQIEELQAICSVWPHGSAPKDFHAPFKSSTPALLISGGRDPVTPPDYAAEVLKGLSDGRSLVVRGLGHAEAIGAGCMPKLVAEFVDKLDPKRLDATCLKRLGPLPAFVDFNGAAP
ncbi:MAG TPA: alpha/beta fold hydrolase [Rhodanobacteraceae bacterium]|nr:alpha/beta fold hydrolase [Rhodanobacteraceae bacterium]